MGVYDIVILEPGVELPDYELDEQHWRVSWQTRSFRDPMYRLHLITEDGLLYRADQDHEGSGLVESHGKTGTNSFLDQIRDQDYDGYPRDYTEFEWERIRYIGEMRITAQNPGPMTIYDFSFKRHSIDEISKVNTPLEPESSLEKGGKVFDRDTNVYEVIEVTDTKAKNYVAKEEVKSRGHTIYEKRTVAELNSDYPEDDRVVIVSPVSQDKKIAWPESRLTDNVFEALDS